MSLLTTAPVTTGSDGAVRDGAVPARAVTGHAPASSLPTVVAPRDVVDVAAVDGDLVEVLDVVMSPPVRRGRTRRRGRAAAVRTALWSVVVVCAGAYGASLLVPLWYGLHDQRLLVVTSGSMAPSFDAGDAVVLQQIEDPSQLRIGQVVSFWPPGSDELVTHRIQELARMPVLEQDTTTGRMVPVLDEAGAPVLREYLITQGDANPIRDPDAVPVSRVRGVVLTSHAYWGAVLSWAHSDGGRLLMLAPPLAALAGMEIASVVQARRQRPAAAVRREGVRADDLALG